ncbi:unnamed protein product [Calicophoron daubneyi]|uniref:Uncharacterized protein n=1 Tax=Calicophoron daubneyi TaxID=300641 RepID=A0AAV2TSE5_CALDB
MKCQPNSEPSSRLSKVNTLTPPLDLNSSHLNIEDLLQQPAEVLLNYLRGRGIETIGLIEKEQLAQRVLDFNRTQISRTPANQDDLSVPPPSWVSADDCSVTLDQIPSLRDVELLSNGQLREILNVHSIDHHALVERDEYVSQVRQLWLDRQEKRPFCI